MANSFSKETKVLFDNVVEGFADGLVVSKALGKFTGDPMDLERASNTFFRPMEFEFVSTQGEDATGVTQDKNLLSVPLTLDMERFIPISTNLREGRDPIQDRDAAIAIGKQLASDVNTDIMARMTAYAGIYVKVATAAGATSGFDDVGKIRAVLNQRGVPSNDRVVAYSTDDYLGLAKDLAGRGTLTGKPQTAYESASVGRNIAGMAEVLEVDAPPYQTAAAGGAGLTIDTRATASNYYVPAAMSNNIPKDNRFQTITISSTTNVAAGDSFTIANVFSVHRRKRTTNSGKLMTFKVVSVDSGTTMTITPPIISAQGGAQIEQQYQNCAVASTSATAAITFLNTVAAPVNLFWYKPMVQLLPGNFAAPANAGAALKMTTSENGIQIHMLEQINADTGKTRKIFRTFYGVGIYRTDCLGIQTFNQT